MIRVALVDDQHLVRAGLRMLCEAAPDLEVVGEARNGQEAIRLADVVVPDVMLMDLRMPGVDGITATERIRASRPAVQIVVLTTFDDDDHLFPAIAAGACGFLVKDAAPEDLLDGIRRAAADDSPFSPSVLRRIMAQAVAGRAATPTPGIRPEVGLTSRETEVLALVGQGLSNAEIADGLHLGVTTVKTHIGSLMTKTGATNRVRLAILAYRHGLLNDG
jgi:DNA-binding NarL/FixJ family response regulator